MLKVRKPKHAMLDNKFALSLSGTGLADYRQLSYVRRGIHIFVKCSHRTILRGVRADKIGIDTQLYRLQIGLFGPCRGYKLETSDKNTEYETHIKGPDIHYRMFATLFLVRVILKISEHVHQQLHPMSMYRAN